MPDANNLDRVSTALARRALFITLSLALVGAAVGLVGARIGIVAGKELVLVLSSFSFSVGALVTLIFFRRVALQILTTTSTCFFAANLCIGVVIAVCGSGDHVNLFVYLLWFFPLLIFNKLVSQPTMGRLLSRILLIAPEFLILCLAPRLIVILQPKQLILVAVYCLSYLCYALALNIVTRYREKYIVECERAESLKVEADILESISDCFISLDSSFRLVYMNDAACAEFSVDRQAALNDTLSHAVPDFFSKSTEAGLQAASTRTVATFFETQNVDGNLWYDVRCFPRPNGMSVYFRNITKSMLARQKLETAHRKLSEQAELLDKAQDAIFLVDLDSHILCWNKGAERLYGWASEEVIGKPVGEVFGYDYSEVKKRTDATRRDGEWTGEVSQSRRDGSTVVVESRCTLVMGDDGEPKSILAINTDITTRKAHEARIQYLAFYDVLTGLPNRQLLWERLKEALATTANQTIMGAVLYIDLDHFNIFNDAMGHEAGDALLRQVALRLTSCMRPGDTVARVGGDQFVVMLERLSEDPEWTADVAKAVGNKILEAFRKPFVVGAYKNDSTVSIGIALFSGATNTIDELQKWTDLAMYRAKAQGGNTMCFFDPAMQVEVDTRTALRLDLRQALHSDELELYYQPQMNSKGITTGAEALLRWFHPQRGRVAPDVFIPLAEEAGLIIELGRWVLETACLQLAAWAGNPAMESQTVSVNVSIRQFLDPQFVNLVRETLRISGANPQRLKLEITESSVMEKVDEIIAKMTELRLYGINFSLDDFGTGYSSLSRLRNLPLDQLKIDRSFVKNVLTDAKDASIARTIIGLGRSLNLTVIAEGVETEAQRLFLEAEGCYMYQGFLYSPAVTASKFEEFVATSLAAKVHKKSRFVA